MMFPNNLLLLLGFALSTPVLGRRATCDKSKCPGPLAYYADLNCTAIYKNQRDCCPYQFNCDYINKLDKDKCYVNGKAYNLGEKLKDEDANPCDIGCTCVTGVDGIADFSCAIVDCFNPPPKAGCYLKNSAANCCPGEEVCPENPEDRATCNVNGKIYKDGEFFEVSGEPDLNCVCQPGYKGENVEPFCVKPKHPYCSPLFRHKAEVVQKCAPVYYSSQSPQTDCSVFSRCQNDNDTLIVQHKENFTNRGMTCQFGNITMHAGDELKQATDYSSVCVKCVCEVGPVPTCERLPDEECDVTKHHPFLGAIRDTFKQTLFG